MIRDRLLSRLIQVPGALTLWKQLPLGSLETRIRYGIVDRPNYAYAVYSAADLAKRLGLNAIQVIEFGVAGGSGLVALESVSAAIGKCLNVEIRVCGFDSGAGMPPPTDYRDLPHVWGQGYYTMDIPRLKARLRPDTELILGDVRTTVGSWTPKAPIGFIAFDLDYYTSTKEAFTLFERASEDFLPRVYSYFDDIMWPEYALHNEWVGELSAIREFNEEHAHRKICPVHMFRHTRRHQSPWNEQLYVFHDFQHPQYTRNITASGAQYNQLPLQR